MKDFSDSNSNIWQITMDENVGSTHERLRKKLKLNEELKAVCS